MDIPDKNHAYPIRVLNCLHRSVLGGPQRRVQEVAKKLREQGVETIILFPRDEETQYENQLRINNLRWARLHFTCLRNWPHVFSNVWFFCTLPLVVRRVIKIIRNEEIDIIHVNGLTNLQPIIAALLCRKPAIWHLNDMLTPKLFVRLMSPLFNHHLIHMAVATPVIISHYALKRLSSSGWRTLPAPLFPFGDHDSECENLRQVLGLDHSIRVLGFVGNLVPLKGVLDFITAAEALMSQDKRLHAVVIGAELHSQRKYAQKIRIRVQSSHMKDRFFFRGYQSNIPSWLKLFDVLVFPSYSEACPMVVLEAMNAGLPMVVTSVGDVPFMLDKIDIPIVEPGNLVGLISGGDRMLKLSSEERKTLGKKLKEQVNSRYALNIVADQHKLIYQEAIMKATPSR